MAAPFVSGVAGLLAARYPGISFDAMRHWIIASADPAVYDPSVADGINYDLYYPKISEESLRQPLLGSGLLNVQGAVTKQLSTGIPDGGALDRVTPQCAVLGTRTTDNRCQTCWLWLLVLLPCFSGLALLRGRTGK